MRMSGKGNETLMILIPLAVLLAAGMVLNGGPWGLATAADGFIRDVARAIAETVGRWF